MQVEEVSCEVRGSAAPWQFANVQLDAQTSNVHVKLEDQEGVRWKCQRCFRTLVVD